MFFSFDGIDGAGKTTQIQRFASWLGEQGRDVVVCRDPGSTPLGEALRDLLLHSGDDRPIGPVSEMLMYMAARAQLVEQVIRPALASGSTVISDRYVLANIVYQAHAGGLDRGAVADVGRVATQQVAPDCVFVLDLDPTEAQRRRDGPADRMESRGEAYLAKVRAGFLSEVAADPHRLALIDAGGDAADVELRVRQAAIERLPELAGR